MSGIYEMKPDAGEPAVRSPELRDLARQARDQRVPTLQVTANELTLEWARARSRERFTMGAMAVAAAVLVAAFLTVQGRTQTEPTPSSTPVVAQATTPQVDSDVPEPAPDVEAPAQNSVVGNHKLAPGVRVELAPAPSEPSAKPHAVVLSAWKVEVASGSYVVDVPPGAVQVFEVLVSKRVLKVEPGSRAVVRADGTPSFEVRHGSARWVETPKGRSPVKDHAAALARKAEAQLSDGNSKGALATLDQLVRKHPNSSSAKAAVLDLARLHRTQGHPAKSRCAYELYLERWPTTRLRSDVERALGKLGDGPACKGLDPKK